MTQRRVHNPNRVDTAGALRYRHYLHLISAIQVATTEQHRINALNYALGELRGVECADCGVWLGFRAPQLCADCKCIRETGEQCRYPDMEQSTRTVTQDISAKINAARLWKPVR